MNINKLKEFGLKSLSFLIISLFACAILFLPGLANGDDSIYHLSQIYDLYHTMVETGDVILKYNHYQFALLGYNVRIFYAPLGHLIVAWLSYFTHLSLMMSYKIIIFLSFFIGCFTSYSFAKKITKNKVLG